MDHYCWLSGYNGGSAGNQQINIILILWSPMSLRNGIPGICCLMLISHYDDVIMDAIASQITSLTIVYSTIYSVADQSKHQSSESLAFVWGIHRGPVNSPHKWPVTRKMFPFDDVIMRAFSTSWCHPSDYLTSLSVTNRLITVGMYFGIKM